MRLIAAACAVIFMMWSLLAAFNGRGGLAILAGIAAGIWGIAFVSITFREEFRRTDDWLGKRDDDGDLR